jgi:hypothetical protein
MPICAIYAAKDLIQINLKVKIVLLVGILLQLKTRARIFNLNACVRLDIMDLLFLVDLVPNAEAMRILVAI